MQIHLKYLTCWSQILNKYGIWLSILEDVCLHCLYHFEEDLKYVK